MKSLRWACLVLLLLASAVWAARPVSVALRFPRPYEPVVNAAASSYHSDCGCLRLFGRNFKPGANVTITNWAATIEHGPVEVLDAGQIVVAGVSAEDLTDGVDVVVANPDGLISRSVHLSPVAVDANALTEADVKTIIAQAVAQAQSVNFRATVAVVDREGNVLGVFVMTGAPTDTVVGLDKDGGLEKARVAATAAAISKAGTGAFLSTQGHAFSTRTASFIVQEHFPPGIDYTPGGPLFGVQFSQLPYGDIKSPSLPLGFSADSGGIPVYKNGQLAGGVGIEGDGRYSADLRPADEDQPIEEQVAVAAARGFDAPAAIRGDQIVANGIRFPFVNTPPPQAGTIPAFDQLSGTLANPIRAAAPSAFQSATLAGLPGRIEPRFFPAKDGSALTSDDVGRILSQAVKQASITRAAIRMPLGSPAQVNIAVVDVDGTVLGLFSTPDAPVFGFDVCVQKARTAAFFSKATAAVELRVAGFGKFVDAAARDGIRLDGSIAFSNRAVGFLSRPFFPDGIDGTDPGPFSAPITSFSPFNTGLQVEMFLAAAGGAVPPTIPGLQNGIQIFPGSVPLYKNGRLVGAIGVSGDGVDQDDLVAATGSVGFEAPAALRSDRFYVRGVRLPYVKFPRHPNL